MTVESAQYIGDFDLTLPRSGDIIDEGDDHIRDVLKKAIVKTFPGAAGNGFAKAITATEDELNYLDGVTAPIQDQFLDYMPLAGDSEKTGELVVRAKIETKGENAQGFGGLSIKNSIGNIKGSFDWNSVDNHLQIQQVGPTDGTIDTVAEIYGGNIEMVAGPGFDTTPTLDTHLATKKYVDDSGAGPGGATEAWVETNFVAQNDGNQAINGELTVDQALRVNATGIDDFDGLVVNYQGFNRAGFVFSETTGFVEMIQNNSFGDNETILRLNGGQGFIEGQLILTATQVAANQAAATSGTFTSADGKTITVTEGLITGIV